MQCLVIPNTDNPYTYLTDGHCRFTASITMAGVPTLVSIVNMGLLLNEDAFFCHYTSYTHFPSFKVVWSIVFLCDEHKPVDAVQHKVCNLSALGP